MTDPTPLSVTFGSRNAVQPDANVTPIEDVMTDGVEQPGRVVA